MCWFFFLREKMKKMTCQALQGELVLLEEVRNWCHLMVTSWLWMEKVEFWEFGWRGKVCSLGAAEGKVTGPFAVLMLKDERALPEDWFFPSEEKRDSFTWETLRENADKRKQELRKEITVAEKEKNLLGKEVRELFACYRKRDSSWGRYFLCFSKLFSYL